MSAHDAIRDANTESREATDRPDHPWNDPDGDGHNCVNCPSSSIWKCDEAAHG